MTCFITEAICIRVDPYGWPPMFLMTGCAVYLHHFSPQFSRMRLRALRLWLRPKRASQSESTALKSGVKSVAGRCALLRRCALLFQMRLFRNFCFFLHSLIMNAISLIFKTGRKYERNIILRSNYDVPDFIF